MSPQKLWDISRFAQSHIPSLQTRNVVSTLAFGPLFPNVMLLLSTSDLVNRSIAADFLVSIHSSPRALLEFAHHHATVGWEIIEPLPQARWQRWVQCTLQGQFERLQQINENRISKVPDVQEVLSIRVTNQAKRCQSGLAFN
jgi:hypothetical protein